jgi:MinD-like ATPase involved in chromosome partitioning or flagellar assembly
VTLAVAAREADVLDAYTLIKRVVHEEGGGVFRIAITHARSNEEAQTVFENLRRVAGEYLGVRLEYIGMSAVPGAYAVDTCRGEPDSGGRGLGEIALYDSVI